MDASELAKHLIPIKTVSKRSSSVEHNSTKMVLELHVWGPAFGLPSIDAECLAAIAYFTSALPTDQWTLVADHDTSQSPQHEFPLLIENGVLVTGFANIIAHLKARSYDLDHQLSTEQRTDRTAFLSFVQSTGGPLIDLSLYVSAENYNAVTSAAYTAILPWYWNYTIPPTRREQARARTAHLGLSSLDVAAVHEDPSQPGGRSLNSSFEAAKEDAGISTQPHMMSMGRKAGVGGLLSSPIYAARFKLDALANELLEPLADLLGKKEYLFGGGTPSSLDCAAFAYLSLMYYPPVPQAWLKEALDVRFPNLREYVERMRKHFLGHEAVEVAKVWTICYNSKRDFNNQETVRHIGLHLPWAPRQSEPVYRRVSKATLDLASRFPVISTAFQNRAIIQDGKSRALATVRSSLPTPLAVNTVFAMIGTMITVMAAMAIQHRRSPREGALIFWALRPQAAGLGEAGEFLSVFANQLIV